MTLGYWSPKQAINAYGMASFKDPANGVTTTWNNTYNRSYLMYLAMDTKPPSFGSAGEFTFQTGSTADTNIRDTLNWEASDQNASTWPGYFYGIEWASGLTQSALMADIQADIGSGHVADITAVNTAYLPSWSGTGKVLGHYVAIVGYNTYNSTFTYVETCGTQCGSDGNGVYSISLSQLYNAIEKNIDSKTGQNIGALIW